MAALDKRGAEIGVRAFPTTRAGHRELLAWLRGLGTVARCGIEGTGAYVARGTAEGRSEYENIRALKRYVARDL